MFPEYVPQALHYYLELGVFWRQPVQCYFAKKKKGKKEWKEKKSLVKYIWSLLPSEQFGYKQYKQSNSGYWTWVKLTRRTWDCLEHWRKCELPGFGMEGTPINGNKAVMLYETNFFFILGFICSKRHILRRENQTGLDLVMYLPHWERPMPWSMMENLSASYHLASQRKSGKRWWGNKQQAFTTHRLFGVSQCTWALIILFREETCLSTWNLDIFYMYYLFPLGETCVLSNILWKCWLTSLGHHTLILDWIPPMLCITISLSFDRIILSFLMF